jgi:hypothetical protein
MLVHNRPIINAKDLPSLLGYRENHGTSKLIIRTLRQYGLLSYDKLGKCYFHTPLAKEFLLEQDYAATLKVLQSPTLFRILWARDQKNGGTPSASDDYINLLRSTLNWTKKASEGVVKAYLQSLGYLRLTKEVEQETIKAHPPRLQKETI